MAEEQGKGIQQIEGCEVIYDMGSGLVIAKVPLDKVKEQDINARIMKNEMQDQLTANIKKRGQLESLPLFVLVDGKLEIISGHHRVKSARAAEMKEIIAIVDVSGLSRSKIAAKQLAHNAISGFDDDSTLREIVKMIDDVDDMIESFVGKEIMEEPLEQYDNSSNNTKKKTYKVGDTVYFKGGTHYVSSWPGAKGYKATAGKAKITLGPDCVGNGKAHPWHLKHLDNKSNVEGWVNEGAFE